MTKKKKAIVVAIILAVVLGGLFLFFQTRRRAPKVVPGAFPKPSIPVSFKGEFPFEFKIEEISLPKELPVLEVSPAGKIPEAQAREVAENFGYDFEPRIAEDIYDGTTYIWEEQGSVLYVRARTKKIEYQAYTNPASAINKQLSNDALIQIAKDFLLSNRLISPEEVEFSSFVFYKADPSREGLYPAPKNEAIFYQLNFSPKFSGFEILTIDPTKTPVYVTLLPDGNVYQAQVTWLGEVKQSQEFFKTKDIEEIKNSLGEAVLVSLDDGNVYLEDLGTEDIQKVAVSEIKAAYFRESPETKIYQPIYLLEGMARVRGFSQEIRATLYLPALSSQP